MNDIEQSEIDLEDLLLKSYQGTRSYPLVIPYLIREVIRLREELRSERMWNATREAAISSRWGTQ